MPYDIQDMITRTREITIEYFGSPITFTYFVEKVTHEFKADMVRLMRASQRLEAERARATEALSEPGAVDSTAAKEEAETEAYLKQLDVDDDVLKRKIDTAVAGIIGEWDMTNKGAPYPPTEENMHIVDPYIEAAIVNAILEDAKPLGEAIGRQNMKLLPPTSKLKAGRVTSRRHRTG